MKKRQATLDDMGYLSDTRRMRIIRMRETPVHRHYTEEDRTEMQRTIVQAFITARSSVNSTVEEVQRGVSVSLVHRDDDGNVVVEDVHAK